MRAPNYSSCTMVCIIYAYMVPQNILNLGPSLQNYFSMYDIQCTIVACLCH